MHGKRRRRSPLKNDYELRDLTKEEHETFKGGKSMVITGVKPKLLDAITTVKSAYELSKDVASSTISSKKNEAKTGFTGRKI